MITVNPTMRTWVLATAAVLATAYAAWFYFIREKPNRPFRVNIQTITFPDSESQN